MKLAIMAAGSLLIGCLGAQTDQGVRMRPEGVIRTVNINGTLLDQSCYRTHTQRTETKTNADNSITTTQITHVVTECPATTSTTSFGVLTPEGRFVGFDDDGNARVSQMMRSNREWDGDIQEHRPVEVSIVGTANGDVVVIQDIR